MWNHVISKLHISASPSCKDLPPSRVQIVDLQAQLVTYPNTYATTNMQIFQDVSYQKMGLNCIGHSCSQHVTKQSLPFPAFSLAVRTQKPVLQAASDTSDGEAGLVENTVELTPTNDQPILSAWAGVLRRFSNGTGEGADFMLCGQTLKALFYRR